MNGLLGLESEQRYQSKDRENAIAIRRPQSQGGQVCLCSDLGAIMLPLPKPVPFNPHPTPQASGDQAKQTLQGQPPHHSLKEGSSAISAHISPLPSAPPCPPFCCQSPSLWVPPWRSHWSRGSKRRGTVSRCRSSVQTAAEGCLENSGNVPEPHRTVCKMGCSPLADCKRWVPVR